MTWPRRVTVIGAGAMGQGSTATMTDVRSCLIQMSRCVRREPEPPHVEHAVAVLHASKHVLAKKQPSGRPGLCTRSCLGLLLLPRMRRREQR